MTWGEVRTGVRRLFRLPLRTADRIRADADEELRAVFAARVDHHVARGMTPDAARAEALSRLGADEDGVRSMIHHSAELRERRMRVRSHLDDLWQDLRYAVRGVRLHPGFALAVAIILGLGIGANTAMFQIVDQLLLRPPAYLRHPSLTHRVYLNRVVQGKNFAQQNIQYRRFQDLARATSSFTRLAAVFYPRVAIGVGSDAREMRVGAVSASTFGFFDARPVVGRFFSPAEDATPSGSDVAVLSYAYWNNHYGADPGVVGQQLQIGPRSFTIIGVAPERFRATATFSPVAIIPITSFAFLMLGRPGWTGYYEGYTTSWMEMLVERRPDVTVAAATTDLTHAFVDSYRAQLELHQTSVPIAVARPHATLGPVLAERGPNQGSLSKVAIWLVGVAAIVLLIACANVANLLLARALRRRREIAVRLAIGVRRGRLLRQLLIESLVLAVLGTTVGVALAQWGGAVLRAQFLAGADPPSLLHDPRALFFALGATVLVGMLTGLAPAAYSLRSDVASTLKAGMREGTHRRSVVRTGLLVLQGALSVVLLVGAGLFVRSVWQLNGLRLGYDVSNVAEVWPAMRGVALDSARGAALRNALLDRARALPEVLAATRASTIPFYQEWDEDIFVAGVDTARLHQLGPFTIQTASPDFFRTMGTRLMRGRPFTAGDAAGAPPVMIVSDAMAAALWPGAEALGKCIRVGADTAPCREVVGIAETARTQNLHSDSGFAYYLPIDQADAAGGGLFVRVRGEATDAADGIRRALEPLMPGVSYLTVTPLTERLAPAMRSWRLGAMMFSLFGALALLLAAFGLYIVVAYSVTQRRHELGVRMALGARREVVLRLVLFDAVRVGAAGILLGGAVALWATRWVAPLLYQVSPRDPAVYAAVAAVLLVVTVAAGLAPALRATRVDPASALRAE